jgi:acyl-CoA synthetase (AMP-forming)/AMP-acid ligase II
MSNPLRSSEHVLWFMQVICCPCATQTAAINGIEQTCSQWWHCDLSILRSVYLWRRRILWEGLGSIHVLLILMEAICKGANLYWTYETHRRLCPFTCSKSIIVYIQLSLSALFFSWLRWFHEHPWTTLWLWPVATCYFTIHIFNQISQWESEI